VQELGSRLEEVPGVRVKAIVFKDEDHAAAATTALEQGLRFVLGAGDNYSKSTEPPVSDTAAKSAAARGLFTTHPYRDLAGRRR
jgi:hypothetical protein